VLGPVPLFRRQGKDRAQLVVRGPDREGQIAAVRTAVEDIAASFSRKGVAVAVDVDPQ
jgi:primosomal protein N' (replication factor Y)